VQVEVIARPEIDAEIDCRHKRKSRASNHYSKSAEEHLLLRGDALRSRDVNRPFLT
jgi:hypothetical protein